LAVACKLDDAISAPLGSIAFFLLGRDGYSAFGYPCVSLGAEETKAFRVMYHLPQRITLTNPSHHHRFFLLVGIVGIIARCTW
jgi:hypothetical protein